MVQELIGKSLATAKARMPGLRELEQVNDYQVGYLDYVIEVYETSREATLEEVGVEFYWVGDSTWTAEFREGRLWEFRVWKG